jgi:hypothetical protein
MGPGARGEKRRPAPKRSRGFAASPAQREKVSDAACVVEGLTAEELHQPVDPAHLCDRSLGGCESAACVVPLSRFWHRAYDEGRLDLLPHLEPNYHAELAHMVEHMGLIAALQRVTNERWAPLKDRDVCADKGGVNDSSTGGREWL